MQNFFLFLTKCVFYNITEYFNNFHWDTINEYFWLLYWTQMCSNPSEQNLNVLSSKNPTVKGDVCNLKTLYNLISHYQLWFMTQTLWFVLSQCIPYRKGGKVPRAFFCRLTKPNIVLCLITARQWTQVLTLLRSNLTQILHSTKGSSYALSEVSLYAVMWPRNVAL